MKMSVKPLASSNLPLSRMIVSNVLGPTMMIVSLMYWRQRHLTELIQDIQRCLGNE